MFKITDNYENIQIIQNEESITLKYLPTFEDSHIKITKSVLTFDRASINNPCNIDVYVKGQIIEQIKMDTNNAEKKICIDITDELNDFMRSRESYKKQLNELLNSGDYTQSELDTLKENETLNIILNGVTAVTNIYSFEINSNYKSTKQAQSNTPFYENNVGHSGQGKINLSTGELTFKHNDANYNNNILPIGVSHIYNSFTIFVKTIVNMRDSNR